MADGLQQRAHLPLAQHHRQRPWPIDAKKLKHLEVSLKREVAEEAQGAEGNVDT
jgi:hypothetical protein